MVGTEYETAIRSLPANDANWREWIKIYVGCSPLLRIENAFSVDQQDYDSNIRDDSRYSRAAFF